MVISHRWGPIKQPFYLLLHFLIYQGKPTIGDTKKWKKPKTTDA